MNEMTPFSVLTEDDKSLIESYIERFAPSEFGRSTRVFQEPLDIVLHEWNTQKATLFKMFGNELIQRRIFSYQQNIEGIVQEMSTRGARETEYLKFKHWWDKTIHFSSNSDNFEIDSLTQTQYTFSKMFYIEQAMSFSALAKNAYPDKEFKIIFKDEEKPFKVSTGMKPMKILHKFVEKYGDEEAEKIFEDFRIWHSRFLNQKTLDGELCLSIHPLDYMTMSDNDNDWTSCMRWADKYGNADAGDYRGGTVECMNSPYIIVAYLHNPKHTFNIGNNWKWNSKRWRELFIVNDGSITEIKGYPYQDENLTNACITWIKELAQKNLGWVYEDEEYNMADTLVHESTGDMILLDYIKPDRMYKDIGVLQKHAGRINFERLKNNKLYDDSIYRYLENINMEKPTTTWYFSIPYGGICTCMFCGEPLPEDCGENLVLCDKCEDVHKCPCCGRTLTNDDQYYIEELDDYICYDCYCDDAGVDNFTDESHMIENMVPVHILLGYDEDERPIFASRVAYCYEPGDNIVFQRVFKSALKKYEYSKYSYTHYVTLDMVNPNCDNEFCTAFDIYPADINNYYITEIENSFSNIVFDYNMQPLWPDEEE